MNIIYDDLQPVRSLSRAPWETLAQRYRNTDPDTSKEAAKAAQSGKAAKQREAILLNVQEYAAGYTAKELAFRTGIPYHDVQRRISEVRGIKRNGEKRDGSAVWVAVETA